MVKGTTPAAINIGSGAGPAKGRRVRKVTQEPELHEHSTQVYGFVIRTKL